MAKELVNMKIDPKEREKGLPDTVSADAPSYPWGLQLNLDEEALDKLGIETLPKVDGELMVLARATVTSVSSNESSGGGKRKSVSLQITDLCLEKPSKNTDAAGALYKEE